MESNQKDYTIIYTQSHQPNHMKVYWMLGWPQRMVTFITYIYIYKYTGLLDVDIKTLRHNKYKNIFGLGDVVDVPTTKATWAAFH